MYSWTLFKVLFKLNTVCLWNNDAPITPGQGHKVKKKGLSTFFTRLSQGKQLWNMKVLSSTSQKFCPWLSFCGQTDQNPLLWRHKKVRLCVWSIIKSRYKCPNDQCSISFSFERLQTPVSSRSSYCTLRTVMTLIQVIWNSVFFFLWSIGPEVLTVATVTSLNVTCVLLTVQNTSKYCTIKTVYVRYIYTGEKRIQSISISLRLDRNTHTMYFIIYVQFQL